MQDNILQNFFDMNLLGASIEDWDLKKLSESANTLAEELLLSPNDISSFILVAFSESFSEGTEPIRKTESIIKEKWPTILGKYREEKPVQLYRGVILDALCTAARERETVAALIWLIGESPFSLRAKSAESELLESIILSCGEVLERLAISDWSIGEHQKELSLGKLLEFYGRTNFVDYTQLLSDMEDAVGPQNEKGEQSESHNTHWPASNDAWAYQFAPRSAEAIKDAIDNALSSFSKNIFNSFQEEIFPNIEYINKITSTNTRKTDLLFWKETLYSPEVKKSYRNLSPQVAICVMAYDLYQQMSVYSPQSVEFLLREAIRELVADGSKRSKVKLKDFVKEISDNEIIISIHEFCIEPSLEGRLTLLDFLRALNSQEINISDFNSYIGVSSEKSFSLEDLSVRLYREFSAERILDVGF